MVGASFFVMNLDSATYQKNCPMQLHINVEPSIDCSIRELVENAGNIISYKGEIVFDTNKPDVARRELMDVSRLEKLGWKAKNILENGRK